jgi:hypothetical protein
VLILDSETPSSIETGTINLAPLWGLTSLSAHGRRAAGEGAPGPRYLRRGRTHLTNEWRGNRQGGGPALEPRGPTMTVGCGSCPPPSARIMDKMPARKRPVKTKPSPPGKEVRTLQVRDQPEADFLRDLDRATTNRAAEKLDRASRPDRASSKT